jgi:hypothetical protein
VNTTMFTMFNLLTSKRNGIFSLIDLWFPVKISWLRRLNLNFWIDNLE